MVHLAKSKEKQWIVQAITDEARAFAQKLKVSPMLAQILINRGIDETDEAKAFLQPKLIDLIEPEKMPGVKQAVERLKKAIEAKEKITIYGDYDVDGITSVSILWQMIRMLGGNVDYYIPHRLDEGYGLNTEAIESLAEKKTKVIVTVDCGVTAIEAVDFAGEKNIDVVITDHHQLASQLPKACAIVHPLLDDDYPNKASCGAMVAFKLAWALAMAFSPTGKLDGQKKQLMIDATSLAAMGTIADVVELVGENRSLASFGLKILSKSSLIGVKALVESVGLEGKGLDSVHVGFRLAPMLNAAGRMGHARLAVELLTSESKLQAVQIADYLKQQNNQRRKYEKKIFKHACQMVLAAGLNHPDNKSIVLADESWHSGVIGIVASRLVDKFHRPTIMINSATKNNLAQGSGRSIAGFNIFDAIQSCQKNLVGFGGHKMAAGVKLLPQNIEKFASDFEKFAKENLKYEDIVEKVFVDVETDLKLLTMAAVTELNMLQPFGAGNREPMFVTKNVTLAAVPRTVGAKNDHLQITVTDNTATVKCIGFSMGKYEKKLANHNFSIAYLPQINHFNGNSMVQLVLKDISITD